MIIQKDPSLYKWLDFPAQVQKSGNYRASQINAWQINEINDTNSINKINDRLNSSIQIRVRINTD